MDSQWQIASDVNGILDYSCSMAFSGATNIHAREVEVNGIVLDTVQVGLRHDPELGVVVDSVHVGFAHDTMTAIVLDTIQVGVTLADEDLWFAEFGSMALHDGEGPGNGIVLDSIQIGLWHHPEAGIVLDTVQVGVRPTQYGDHIGSLN
jgi:hypothetical protein